MAKKNKYSVIINVNLEYIVEATTEDEAENKFMDADLPKEYVEDSFEIVKIGLIGKDGYANYGD